MKSRSEEFFRRAKRLCALAFAGLVAIPGVGEAAFFGRDLTGDGVADV